MSDEKIGLRAANPSDLKLIKKIFKSQLHNKHSVAFPEGFKLTADFLIKNCMTSSPSFWAFEEQGQVFGYAYHFFMRRCKTACISGGMFETARNKGRGSRGLHKYIMMLFNKLPIKRIEAFAPAINIPSNKLLLGLGFVLEGSQRNAVYIGGKASNYNFYGMLKNEFIRKK